MRINAVRICLRIMVLDGAGHERYPVDRQENSSDIVAKGHSRDADRIRLDK